LDFHQIVAELTAERDRIDQAISALQAVNSTEPRRAGRQPRAAEKPRRRGRMSDAARRKMSLLMKQRWAQGKMGKKASTTSARTSKPTHRISAAGRRRIAEATKRRWAEWRKKARAA
jgi:hypothetical protein